jgi:hypothetical protein
MTLDEFRGRFVEIKDGGFIRSTRRGPTGVGHTFETLLGLQEDNIAMPDLGEVEVKARRAGSGSMVTLFTYDRGCWKVNPLGAIRKYGTPDENGRLGMYFTMSRNPNNSGLFIDIDEENVSVKHITDGIIATWNLETLARQFERKLPALIVVSALNELRDGIEWFHYIRAQLLKGTSPDILREQIAEGNVLIDLRLHDKGTSARNHGTGFRTFEDKLPLLFESVEDL